MDILRDIDAKMDPIEYGWVDKNGHGHTDTNDFSEKYRLQSPKQLLDSCLGVCWDQVELERELFKNIGISTRSFFIVHYDKNKCPTHTFVLFKYDDKIYWYEHAWSAMRGLHKFNNFNQAILHIKNAFIKKELQGKYHPQNLVIYEYDTPPNGLSCLDFYKHCEKGKQVQVPS